MLVFTLVGCDRAASPANAAAVTEADINIRFPVHVGRKVTQLRVAVTELEKSQGLMMVKDLPASEGMAFIYTAPQQMNFWMKDTLLDLDIAFVLADGTIDEVRTMQAGDTRDTHSRSDQILFTVELPAGWFQRSGVQSGDKVNLADLKKALATRGFKSERYIK
jgi:uncharacterized membrane protein (UPF0127 family)